MKFGSGFWASILSGVGSLTLAGSLLADGELVIGGLPTAPFADNPACFSATGQFGPCSSPTPVENIIWVAKSGGDFSDPVAAVDSITDAGEDNIYLVKIGPGVFPFTAQLQLREYVYIEGSGRHVTKLTGTFSAGSGWSDATAVHGKSNSGMKNLTVINNCTGGAGMYCVAIYNRQGASPSLSGVTLLATGSADFTAAIRNDGSETSPTFKTVTAKAQGVATNYGMHNTDNCSPNINRSKIVGENGVVFNYGVFNSGGSVATIHHSTIVGSSNTVYNQGSGSGANIFSSKLNGGNVLVDDADALKCAYVTDENYTAPTGTCP